MISLINADAFRIPLRDECVQCVGHVLEENQKELADTYGSALEVALAEQEKNG